MTAIHLKESEYMRLFGEVLTRTQSEYTESGHPDDIEARVSYALTIFNATYTLLAEEDRKRESA